MNKININGLTQEANCEQLDAIAHDYLGVQTSLDDESYGCRAGAEITLPTTITATDGVYSDTKEAFGKKGVTVGGTEYVRVLDADTLNFLNTNGIGSNGIITKAQANAVTSIPTELRNYHVSVINKFVNATTLPAYFTEHGIRYSTRWSFKYIKYLDAGNFGYESINYFILPSIIRVGSYFGESSKDIGYRCVDFGPNLNSIWGGFLQKTSSTINAKTTIIIRGNRPSISDISGTPRYFFVKASLLDEYKSTSPWSSYSSKIFPIGGPTWLATFGSTDPYADLTEEEKSWYDDLFPDLYKDWVAPTSDE